VVIFRLVALLVLTAGCVRYQAQPLDPLAHPAEYRARRLDDPRLRRYLAKYDGGTSDTGWTDHQLALLALQFRPELARARASWRAAEAAVVSAAGRPQPGVEANVERAVSGEQGSSPWVVGLAGLSTVELGGKRGARLQHARATAAVWESDLRSMAWQIIQDVRRASLSAQLAERDVAQARSQLAVLDRVRSLEQSRFAEAALTSAELSRTVAEVQAARAILAAAERGRIAARAELARVVGISPMLLRSVSLASSPGSGCAWVDSLPGDSIEAMALTRRPEVGRALVGYAQGEANLRLQVTQQYPNLEAGPGFIWDQGVHRWTLALALPALLAFRNRGPIHQAKAERDVLAYRVFEAQETVLGEVAAALEMCRGSGLERAAAAAEVAAAEQALARTRAAYQRGETGLVEVSRGELGLERARGTLRAAEGRTAESGLVLERAAGDWRAGSPISWPDPRTSEQLPGTHP
jgi:outer membrane protein, heavy metal efflux system